MAVGKEFTRVRMVPEIRYMRDSSEKRMNYGTSLQLETKPKINSCIKRRDKQTCEHCL